MPSPTPSVDPDLPIPETVTPKDEPLNLQVLKTTSALPSAMLILSPSSRVVLGLGSLPWPPLGQRGKIGCSTLAT